MMRKKVAFSIALAMVLLCFLPLSASAEKYDVESFHDHETFETAVPFSEKDLGKTRTFLLKQPLAGGTTLFFSFTAPEEGTACVSVTINEFKNLKLTFYDKNGKQTRKEALENNGQKYVYEVPLRAGEKMAFEIGQGPNNFTGSVSVCFNGHHKEGAYSEISRNATCTEPGEVVWPCELCGRPWKTEEIPATGHTPGEEGILQEATCLQEGLKGVTCTTCGEVLSSEPVPKAEHVPGPFTAVKKATCNEDGKNEQHCTVCNATLAAEDVPALGHTPGVWEEIKPATCLEAGERAQRCETCGETLKTETVEAFGHSPMEWAVTREAGCEQGGLREKKCAICGAVLESETTDALGHSYTEWEVLVEPTLLEEGERVFHCVRCGDTQLEKLDRISFFGMFTR